MTRFYTILLNSLDFLDYFTPETSLINGNLLDIYAINQDKHTVPIKINGNNLIE